MDMKIFMFPFLLFPFLVGGCSDNAPKTETKTEAQEQLVQTYTVERYKLFPTQNMWTLNLTHKLVKCGNYNIV